MPHTEKESKAWAGVRDREVSSVNTEKQVQEPTSQFSTQHTQAKRGAAKVEEERTGVMEDG